MPTQVDIALLADRPEAIPILKNHFESEWDGWYGPGGPGDAEEDLLSFTNRDRIPVGIVAFLENEVVGVAALKPVSIETHKHLSPWAAAGWVVPKLRRQGIGAALLQGLEELAKDLGFPSVYCGTSTATGLLERNGWERLETVPYHGEQVSIFRKDL